MTENIESRVAKAVLQKGEEVTVGNEVFEVAPPSTATLILVSEETAKLPSIELDSTNITTEALVIAKDCRVLGDIVAILILGAKNLVERRKDIVATEKRHFFGLIKRVHKEETEVVINHKADLAQKLLENLSPRELHNLTARLLKALQIADFFGFTTSLIEVNLIRKTREVVNETTAFGQ
jgi:hypothetical protein